jgi:hypothetical protein
MICVQIICEPAIYAEALAHVLKQFTEIHIVDVSVARVDVVVFPLDAAGEPQTDLLPNPLPNAKLIASSVTGNRGLVRLPGESEWQEVCPFGLDELILEVLAGSRRPDRA